MEEEEARKLAQHLSVLIGMIMEDEVDGALSATPGGPELLLARLAKLRRAGGDIELLAAAGEALMRRYGHLQAGD